MGLQRGPLLADSTRSGAAWCRAHSEMVDAWLAGLLEAATTPGPRSTGAASGVALVAVGGYGRSELCPQSDIDVMLVHDRRGDVSEVADRVWYPVWDEALHLGHSVCTVRQALDLAEDDLDTATALLSARLVAGDPGLAVQLAGRAGDHWRRRSKRWLTELGARVELRHELSGEVAFNLEPDLKEGRGGLRDVHALRWAEAAGWRLLDEDAATLDADYRVLLDARVELHRRTGRSGNVLALEDQDGVAAAVGVADADALMGRVAEAARQIAWTSDDTWRRIRSAIRGPVGRRAQRTQDLGDGIDLRDGEVRLDLKQLGADDPAIVLRVARAAAVNHAVIERATLERMASAVPPLPDPWPEAARALFVELLLAGSGAIRVVEALDQRGLWVGIIPEWAAVRARPQRNPYHRFTVDRHLLEATAHAARLAGGVRRPDLLVTGALLHDLGKGYAGDHTDVGVELAQAIGTRMGYPDDDVATLVALVRHHLLLPDVATRRDLDDPTTVLRVAEAVGTLERLRLLAALTEADSLATGPAAWGYWKAGLVGQLVERVAPLLGGQGNMAAAPEQFPTSGQLARLAEPGRRIEVEGDVLTVMTDDRPGLFSRVAGVMALHGLGVLRAAAHSSEQGRALAEFRVVEPGRWAPVVADLELVLDGRLAVQARLGERARTYSRNRPPPALRSATTVTFDRAASLQSLVIDVRAPDGVGVLYRITRALAELDLDIRGALVQTMGHQVVDSFYVRDSSGGKITDAHLLGEIERAILHSLRE